MKGTILSMVPAAWAAPAGGNPSGSIMDMVLGAGAVVKLVLVILVLLSVACWAVIFLKHRLLKKANQESSRFLHLFWNSKNLATVYREASPFLQWRCHRILSHYKTRL